MKKNLQFYFIRHGKTEWNAQRLLQGSGDSPLTQAGIIAAQNIGHALEHISFVAGFSSQQKRAQDTLSYIVGTRDIPCYSLADFGEMQFGCWEGQSIEALRLLPEYQQLLQDPEHYRAESNGGETFYSVYQRGLKAVHQIIAQYDEGAILVVSHGMILRLLLHVLAGGDWRTHRDEKLSQRLDNTGVSQLHYTQEAGQLVEAGQFTVIELNNTEYANKWY